METKCFAKENEWGERKGNSSLKNPNSPEKERERDDNDPDYKSERKRKFNALREDYGKEKTQQLEYIVFISLESLMSELMCVI